MMNSKNLKFIASLMVVCNVALLVPTSAEARPTPIAYPLEATFDDAEQLPERKRLGRTECGQLCTQGTPYLSGYHECVYDKIDQGKTKDRAVFLCNIEKRKCFNDCIRGRIKH